MNCCLESIDDPLPKIALYRYTMSMSSKVTCSVRMFGPSPKDNGTTIFPRGRVALPPNSNRGLSADYNCFGFMPILLMACRKMILAWLSVSTRALRISHPTTLQLTTIASVCGALQRLISLASNVRGTCDHFVWMTDPFDGDMVDTSVVFSSFPFRVEVYI
jgi:hypothetical protein